MFPFSGILILGSVSMNSPSEGSYMKPFTPRPRPSASTIIVAEPYSAYPAATTSRPGRNASVSDGSPDDVFLHTMFSYNSLKVQLCTTGGVAGQFQTSPQDLNQPTTITSTTHWRTIIAILFAVLCQSAIIYLSDN